MDRCREGRWIGTGIGTASAPRRPRTGGLKDAPVAEDGDDMTDDSHNPRFHERLKKDSGCVTAAQAIPSSSLGLASRNKRKRHGSQEVQGQARSSTADDPDETTEDTEVGASDDDDDPPPPPIPRRNGKYRPQGKLMDDGISIDLPAVPRKARTATLKRPQELSVPAVDAHHQGLTSICRIPSSASEPSSSSIIALKPGRRFRHNSSKPCAAKVHKVSIPTIVSEQEVEVAEALFDLARMFSGLPASSTQEVSVDSKPEPKAESKHKAEPKFETEVKPETKPLAYITVPCPPPSQSVGAAEPSLPAFTPVLTPFTRSQILCHNPPATISLPATISSVLLASATLAVPAVTASPMFSSSPTPATAPPAEAPKRKRPRFKAKADEVTFVPQIYLPGTTSTGLSGMSVVSPARLRPDSEQMASSPRIRDKNPLTGEACIPALLLSVSGPATLAVAASLSELETLNSSSLGTTEQGLKFFDDTIASDKVVKVESSSISSRLDKMQVPVLDRKLLCSSVLPSPPTMAPVIEPASNCVFATESLSKLEFETRISSTTTGGCHSSSLITDLMAPSVVKPALAIVGKSTMEVTANTSKDALEKDCADVLATTARLLWRNGENERDRERESQLPQGPMEQVECKVEQDREVTFEREGKCDWHRSQEGQRGFLKERDMERGEAELIMKDLQVPVKSLKLDNKGHKMERAAPAISESAASAPLVASTTSVSVSSSMSTLPPTVGIGGWSVGVPPMGYYSSAAAAAGWAGSASLGGSVSVDEITSAVQLHHPCIIQARQPQHWKRCASHVYIAHFIDLQQQMSRHPFIQAAFQKSSSVYGTKPYNLNVPLPPADSFFGNSSVGTIRGGVNAAAGASMVVGVGGGPGSGGPGSEKGLGSLSAPANSLVANDRVHMELLGRKQTLQQQQQIAMLSSNLSLQDGPGIGFPVTQAGTIAAAGVAANPVPNGGVSAGNAPSGGSVLFGKGSSILTAPGPVSNGGVSSHAAAQAQYLQAVIQQGGFPFSFQTASHFGNGFSVPPGHIGPQQAPQFLSSPFITTHVLHTPVQHTPVHAQQQLQQSASVSGGLASAHKQYVPQQGVRSFPPSSQQQSPSQLSCHSVQQHSQGPTAQQIPRLSEREGNSTGDSSSSAESKLPLLQKNVYSQGNPNCSASSLSPASLVLGVVTQPMPHEFNLVGALGSKQTKQQQLTAQHHLSGPALQIGLKGLEQPSVHAFSSIPMPVISRASVGPGPLGLAPVAAMMAPQGHAMLHSFVDSRSQNSQFQHLQSHQSALGQAHQLSLPSGGQQQRGMQMQRGVSVDSGIDDGRMVVDGNVLPGRSVRETAEERKFSTKRALGSTLNVSRVDVDTPTTLQGSPTGGLSTSRQLSHVASTLNLMTPSAVLVSRPSGHPAGSVLQHAGPVLLGSQNPKQTVLRSKVLAGSCGATSAPPMQSQSSSLPDRSPLGPSLSGKVPGQPFSLSGQSMGQSTQVPRQGQVSQLSQQKLSNRGSIGSLATPSGTTPPVVLATALTKVHQGPQQHQTRLQGQVGAGPPPRLPSGNPCGVPMSTNIPLPPLPPAAKTSTYASKSTSPNKGSFSLSHKLSSSGPGKRATPSTGVHVSSIMSASSHVQNLASKSCQQQQQSQLHHSLQQPPQQQQNISQHHTQPLKQLPSQSLQQLQSQPSQASNHVQHQQFQQHPHLNSQLHQVNGKQVLMQQQQPHQMHRHIFLQSPGFQQHQQGPGSPLSSHHQQQGLHPQSQQYSAQQLHHQASSTSPQPQHPSPQLHHHHQQPPQQPQLQLHHHQQQHISGVVSTAANGSLSLVPPTLTLGTSNIGNNSCLQSPGSDCLASAQDRDSGCNAATSKVSCGSGAPLLSSASQRNQSSGPSFPHAPYGCSISSGQQHSSSPLNGCRPYLAPVCSPGTSETCLEENSLSDRNDMKEKNDMLLISTSSPSAMPQMPLSSSPGVLPVSNRVSTMDNLSGKPGGQFSGIGCGESVESRSGILLSVTPPSLSSNGNVANMSMLSNSGSCSGLASTIQLGSDERPVLSGSTSVSNQGHTGSQHQSSHMIAPGTMPSNSNAHAVQPGMLGQTSSLMQP